MTVKKGLIINGRFLTQPVTGVQRYAREILREFDDMAGERPDVEFSIYTPRDVRDVPALRNIRHEAIGSLRGHAWEQFVLPRYVDGNTLFCPGNTAPIATLLGKTRVVVAVHSLSHIYFPAAYQLSYRLVYGVLTPMIFARASSIITVSDAERREILGRFPKCEARLTAIQNGGLPADADTLPTLEPRGREAYVLYVGSLSKGKNLEGLLAVAIELARKRDIGFVFVGSTPSALAESPTQIPVDIAPMIRFEGQVNDWQKLRVYYQSAACFLFPSFYEASPLPPIEAMACGCPVVASRIPSLEERCGSAALYCDPNSSADMVATIEKLLDDPDLAERQRALGLQRARLYSWRRCAEKTLDVILGGDSST